MKFKYALGKVSLAFKALWREFIVCLPDEFSKYRVSYYNRNGCKISRHVSISPNVRLRGLVEIGPGSSIAQNCSINGMDAGVRIGKNVMIAPNVVIVAFAHGYANRFIDMKHQENIEAAVTIGDNVWICANVTVGKGCTIGNGTIIGANSFVNSDVPPFSIVTGVPAGVLRAR